MDRKLQIECYNRIKKYKSLKTERYKAKHRNDLFIIMKDYMVKWCKAVISKWGFYIDEGDILSTSWDAFLFCLDYYNPSKFDTHVPLFFYKYTRYFLLMKYAKQQSVFLSLEELSETLELVESPENMAFGRLIKIQQLKDSLPDDCKVVWDDAFLSLTCNKRREDGYRSKEIGMMNNTYLRLKKSFIGIMKHILEE